MKDIVCRGLFGGGTDYRLSVVVGIGVCDAVLDLKFVFFGVGLIFFSAFGYFSMARVDVNGVLRDYGLGGGVRELYASLSDDFERILVVGVSDEIVCVFFG